MPLPSRSIAAAALALGLVLAACSRPHPDADSAAFADDHYLSGALSFARYCSLCHGVNAEGYAADHAPSFKSPTFLATVSSDYLARGIREGRPGTAMGAYGKARGGPLDEDEIVTLIDFLRTDAGPVTALPQASITGDATNGAAVYSAHCQQCHGTRTDRGNAVHLGNSVFLSSASDVFLRYAIVHGRPGTPMPSFANQLTLREIDDVVTTLRSWATPPPNARSGKQEPPPLGNFILNPKGKRPSFKLKDGRYVPNADVLQALEQRERLVIIDARPTSDWYSLRIPGSISVPYYSFDRLDSMPRDGTWILAYCACPHHASGAVVDELRKRGFSNTGVLDEGIMHWKQSGYPITSDPVPEDVAK